MKTTIILETKEVRTIISKYLGIPLEQVEQTRYSFAVAGLTESEILSKINDNKEGKKK